MKSSPPAPATASMLLISERSVQKLLASYQLQAGPVAAELAKKLSTLVKRMFKAMPHPQAGGRIAFPMDYFTGVANPTYAPVQSATDMSATAELARPALLQHVGGAAPLKVVTVAALSRLDLKNKVSREGLKDAAARLNKAVHDFMQRLCAQVKNGEGKVTKAAIQKAYASFA